VICQNWGNALGNVGRLDDAKATYLRSAEAVVRAGSPRLDALASEMEALRIDVMQGRANQALPEVESRLHEIRAWWQRRGAGEVVPEAPDSVFLARALIAGLDIAAKASRALEKWEVGLGIITELEETQRAMGEGVHGLAVTRFNRHGPLLRLGRLVEAEEVLESCLAAFRDVFDSRMRP
jgi:predicted transcriptional regulator